MVGMSGNRYDIVIVGAGIAGASLGAALAGAGGDNGAASILLVEMEALPGYHTTGRAVAFWSESYGGPGIAPLTRASQAALARPAPDFSERSFLTPRGGIHIGRAADGGREAAMKAAYGPTSPFRAIAMESVRARVPGLRAEWCRALEEPGIADIDAAALLGACLARFRRDGGTVRTDCRFASAASRPDGGWTITLSSGETVRAGRIVNAAGAWADDVARACGVRPVGIRPLLRTVAQVRVAPADVGAMPLVLDMEERFYFKPVAPNRIWLTPHDEQPSVPGDAAPDELDVAVAIERLQQVVDWRVEAVERKWAGLRSFAPDRLPVYGEAPDCPEFFWFAGQGGFGLQTAPAGAWIGRHLLLGTSLVPELAGVDVGIFSPRRFF